MKNAEEIKQSGLLELYVAGKLSASETAEVESYILTYPELADELSVIEESVYLLTTTYAKKAPDGSKSKILEKIRSGNTNSPVIPITGRKSSMVEKEEKSNWWMLAAAIALLVISGVFNVIFYQNWQDTRQDLIALEQSQDVIASDLVRMSDSLANVNQQLAIIHSPEYINIELKGLDIAPESRAIVYWNPQTQESFINVKSLPPAPAGKQYQLWALADGTPVDAGVFDVDDTATALKPMKPIASAGGWAVTLEPAGGSINPTLEAMYLFSGS